MKISAASLLHDDVIISGHCIRSPEIKEMGRRDQEASAASSTAPPLRKGPWMAEEDAVLVEYVRKHGPRDWSCIRHKGLLPRSGKSCRLRWVNKLKPDLKTGCKFSPEEEKVVIELQAQLGNKWARIATYLPGRTDNDVKNFWSTRQKRLARLLLQAQCYSDKANSQGKLGCKSPAAPLFHQAPIPFQEYSTAHSLVPGGEQFSSKQLGRRHISPSSSTGEPPLSEPVLINVFEADHVVAPISDPCSERKQPFVPSNPPPPRHFSFLQLPEALVDLPLLPETHHLATDFDGVDDFNVPEFDLQLAVDGLPCLDQYLGSLGDHVKVEEEEMVPAGPDGFFGDFPVDMLDTLNPPPPSSSRL